MIGVRILIAGVGAVGGYYGALLARAGHDVVFLARGATLEALRREGLTVRQDDGSVHLGSVVAVDDPGAAPRPEAVLVCVKSYDTRAIAERLRTVVGPDTIVLSLQNGIDNEAVLAEVLGLPPLLVGLTRIGVELEAPGVVRYVGRGEIDLGEPDGRASPRAQRLAEAFTSAGIRCRIHPTITVAAWEKLAWNAGFNAVTTLTDATVGEVLAQPASRALVRRAMEETDATASAAGIAVRRRRIETVLAESAREMASFATSMLQDRRRGRRLEHDALNGAVVRAAARVGIAAPVNTVLHGLLVRLDPGARR